jgi:rhodanese-related sulfurtransferase/TusA-related sulfurtransferase
MIKTNTVLDAKGLACPMPIVKTKKAVQNLAPGEVVEVQATDQGSTADLEAWAKSSGHQYLGTVEEGDVLKHYVRKGSSEEEKQEIHHDQIINNEELEQKLDRNENIVVVDVREQAEYAFHHIPGAVSIPLGEMEDRLGELNKEDDIYVVCRTGKRSDLACRQLVEQGFSNVTNVLPGMSEWQNNEGEGK